MSPHQVLHCPVCTSQELSAETSYASFETHARFAGLGGSGMLGGAKDLTMGASRCRVCLTCGHLILFVSESDRRRLESVYAG